MKLSSLVTAFVLATTGTAVASRTTAFDVPTGTVKVSIRILATEGDTSGAVLPGHAINALLTIENTSTESVELALPSIGMRVPVDGRGTASTISQNGRVVVAPGDRMTIFIGAEIPEDADVGTRVKIGAAVALASNMDDVHVVFDSAPIAGSPSGPLRDQLEKLARGR
ncbi:MAG: hypothetical protein HYR85_26315 [Planctomycetes bacterium]|nr:hypothetical protein [Planctomycetota bacterium]MBI3844923.1 hypothetical protein [Planctomycetota bacterium]